MQAPHVLPEQVCVPKLQLPHAREPLRHWTHWPMVGEHTGVFPVHAASSTQLPLEEHDWGVLP